MVLFRSNLHQARWLNNVCSCRRGSTPKSKQVAGELMPLGRSLCASLLLLSILLAVMTESNRLQARSSLGRTTTRSAGFSSLKSFSIIPPGDGGYYSPLVLFTYYSVVLKTRLALCTRMAGTRLFYSSVLSPIVTPRESHSAIPVPINRDSFQQSTPPTT